MLYMVRKIRFSLDLSPKIMFRIEISLLQDIDFEFEELQNEYKDLVSEFAANASAFEIVFIKIFFKENL